MTVLDGILGKGKQKTQIMMTAIGKERMEEKNIQPTTPEGKILWFIRDHTQCNLGELADDTGISYSKTKEIVNKYASGEWRWLEWV